MKIAVDIDGVLADFNREFARIANDIWPGKFPPGYEATEWNFGLSDSDVSQVWKRIKAIHNFWIYVRGYTDSIRAVATHRLERPEDEIIYCTARAVVAGLPVVHQCQRWLDMIGIGGIGTNVIVKPEDTEKAEIYAALEVDASVDDHLPTVIENDRVIYHRAFLLDQPWNRTDRPKYLTVVSSLSQFFKEIKG